MVTTPSTLIVPRLSIVYIFYWIAIEPGSKEKSEAVEALAKLYKLRMEEAKNELEFEDIEANADGYYALTDIINRIQDALDLYDEYAEDEALAPAA